MTRIEGGRRGTPDWWAAEWEGDSPFYDGSPSPEVTAWIVRNAVGRRDYDRLNAELVEFKSRQGEGEGA